MRRALELLRPLVPDAPGRVGRPAPRRCPVLMFAQRYLAAEPGSDMTSDELWRFYAEVAAVGELEPVSKSEFLRRLPGVMEATFGARKCHSIRRAKGIVRGFKGATVREDGCAVMR